MNEAKDPTEDTKAFFSVLEKGIWPNILLLATLFAFSYALIWVLLG